MKPVQLITLVACTLSFAGCESTGTTQGGGTQEAKRLAAVRQERQEQAQVNEAQSNLWHAQGNVVNRDGNPNALRSLP